jgi:hypothetical protein
MSNQKSFVPTGFNTLAQGGTSDFLHTLYNTTIAGVGTAINENPALLKRANKKVITNALVLALIDVARANGDFGWVQRYWNTYHCQNELTSYEGNVYGNYCKNRWCTTCCGIRKADFINRYFSIINDWPEPHLLTLTTKSVRTNELSTRISVMIKNFSKIKDRCNKRHQRGSGMKLIGIKSLECNYNATKGWYNPHFHLIVPTRVMGLYIKQEWKKEWNKNAFMVGEKGQDLRPVGNTEQDLVEVIKYGAKILTDPDPSNKRKRKKGDLKGFKIYANALHNIYKAFDKRKLFVSFGFNLDEASRVPSSILEVQEFENWKYNPKEMDWINSMTGKRLTEYQIDYQLENLLKDCIDLELC